MIKELKRVNKQTLNMILYVDNSALQYYIAGLLKGIFNVAKDSVLFANNKKTLKEAQRDSAYVPDNYGRWLVNIDTTKIAIKDLTEALKVTHVDALNVYWVSNYRVYKELIKSDIVEKQGVFCYSAYIGRLSEVDIYEIFRDTFKENKPLNDKLLAFVAESYQWDVQAVFDLISYLKSGNEFSTRKDIIEAVGVGGNTVDKFTVNLLLCNPVSLKGKKMIISKYLKLLEDLSFSYKYSTIRNFMLNTVNGFIDMKQLQIMGMYRRGKARIPDSFDSKRLSRLRRYEWAVLDKITLPRLILLRQCLASNITYNFEIELVRGIIQYIDMLYDTSYEALPIRETKTKKKPVSEQEETRKSKKKEGSLKKKDSVEVSGKRMVEANEILKRLKDVANGRV